MIKHKHQQLYDLLSEELRRGTWPCNEKLPNLKELAARYNVSINVASKAVELLKEAHLVSVKVGDGIYSETSGQAELVDFKYSGERLFGQYTGAKTLRILMQDKQMDVLNAIKLFSDEGLKSTGGLSNNSNGAPKNVRPIMDSALVAMAMMQGLTSAIVNPNDLRLMETIKSCDIFKNNELYSDSYLDA